MQEPKRELDEMFRQMDRMRKAWEHVNPSRKLNKSQFGTLFALARLSGAREKHAACGGAAQGENMPRCGEAGYGEAAAQAAKPVTLSELAAAMHQSLPALSQRVTALEEKGFVERVADPADRRVTGLRLTETGRGEMDAAFRRFSGILSQAAERVGRQNMCMLLRLLGELADALNEAAGEAGKAPPLP